MVRAVWLSDIHLNFVSPVATQRFFAQVQAAEADVILISGDIGEAPRLAWYLHQMETAWARPIYFVLGNHDFYKASFAEVHAVVRKTVHESQNLLWMRDAGIVELSPHTALIGHDSWADGRCGDYLRSNVVMNDYVFIHDFSGLDKVALWERLKALGDEAAAYVQEWLPKTLEKCEQVFFLTHVPPFREACWHMGQPTDDNYLPHFACEAVGDALADIMRDYPQRQLTVLCGHTHSPGRVYILDNLIVLTGKAEYGKPIIQQMLDIE